MISHSDFTTVRTTDPDGNLFEVRHDGSHTLTLSEEYKQKMAENNGVTTYKKVHKRYY